jgi:hypothetical protein
MQRTLVLVGLGLMALPGGPARGQEKKEERLPMSTATLFGKWAGRLGDAAVTAEFNGVTAFLHMENKKVSGNITQEPRVDSKANLVRFCGMEGCLVKGGLRLTVQHDYGVLPVGAVITLGRPKSEGD